MKKFLISILLLTLSFSFVGCGDTPRESGSSGSSSTSSSSSSSSSSVGGSSSSSGNSAKPDDSSSNKPDDSSQNGSSNKPDDSSSKPDDGTAQTAYTVTWKNYDGTLLEVDEEVPKGAMPSYDGGTPTRQAKGDFTYSFSGWTPAIVAVSANATYTATFHSVYNGQSVAGMQPTLTSGGSILYGLYPQSYISDAGVVTALNALAPSEVNGWYLYNGEYYAKEKAEVYSGEKYTFDDGTEIVSGTEYWFKCQPIEWKVLTEKDGGYYLLSSMLLDAGAYYSSYESRSIDGQTVYANNYAESDIRSWLNGEFYHKAFAFNSSFVQAKSVDNGAGTTDLVNNPYAAKSTLDFVFLPSYQDYLNADYGFVNDGGRATSREGKTTEYARATGAWCHTRNNSDKTTRHNGSYWTRSASGEYEYCASVVNAGGVLSSYAVDEKSHSVRPAIYISAESVK